MGKNSKIVVASQDAYSVLGNFSLWNSWSWLIRLQIKILPPFFGKSYNNRVSLLFQILCELLDVVVVELVVIWEESSLFIASTQECGVRMRYKNLKFWRMIGTLNQHGDWVDLKYMLKVERLRVQVYSFLTLCWKSSKGSFNKSICYYEINDLFILSWNAL